MTTGSTRTKNDFSPDNRFDLIQRTPRTWCAHWHDASVTTQETSTQAGPKCTHTTITHIVVFHLCAAFEKLRLEERVRCDGGERGLVLLHPTTNAAVKVKSSNLGRNQITGPSGIFTPPSTLTLART